MSGTLPDFSKLPNLETLNLIFNQLSGEIPDFANLTKLTDLSLSFNQLTGEIPNFSNLPALKYEEGVYGLQRAFRLAGANKLIMSLWEVDDAKTKRFMVTFYKNLLSGHATIQEAFQKTQKDLRDVGIDPEGWAAFVLLE